MELFSLREVVLTLKKILCPRRAALRQVFLFSFLVVFEKHNDAMCAVVERSEECRGVAICDSFEIHSGRAGDKWSTFAVLRLWLAVFKKECRLFELRSRVERSKIRVEFVRECKIYLFATRNIYSRFLTYLEASDFFEKKFFPSYSCVFFFCVDYPTPFRQQLLFISTEYYGTVSFFTTTTNFTITKRISPPQCFRILP